MIRFCRTRFNALALSAAALFLMATPPLARAQANRGLQTSPQAQTPTEINERLQRATEKVTTSEAEAANRESTIGPDDLLNISVFEAPEMNCAVRVAASGEISLPMLGAVPAAGLTPRELEAVLQGLLRRSYIKDPHVGVFVQELQSHPVSVVGAVKSPGVFQIRGSKTVIEVLSLAQGLSEDAGDVVLIMRGAGIARRATANTLNTTAGVSLVASRNEVFPSANSAPVAPPERKYEIVEINLKRLLESADSELNVTVFPGDIVKVPRAGIVYVVGEVTKPGGFVLQNNERISVLQALALAQGPTHTSAIGRARIIRTDPETGTRTEIPTNISRIFSGKAPDPFLQPKDVIFVPNSAAKSVLYRGSETALQTAAGVAIYKW
ncbi:MAG TPA: polysaccharide biosynthesis/export family protein [Candidatus Acidoferrales bacterium]|nr:polysaccharide biosynthesis/export family protein [Candidatus Acidoferrales bacterium]